MSDATLALLDEPQGVPLRTQLFRFRYGLNVEGHGGWADRLYFLLLSPQLVLAQDLPMRAWCVACAPARPRLLLHLHLHHYYHLHYHPHLHLRHLHL